MVNQKDNKAAGKVLIGAGLVAGAALAAYLLSSTKGGKKAVKQVKGWMHEMQKETAERVKQAQELTQDKYNQIIDDVKPKYETLKDVSASEVAAFTDELKSHWKNISGAVKKVGSKKKK